MILIVTIIFLCLAIPDIISIFKEKDYNLIWLYSSILILSYAVAILISLDVKLPSPQPLIKNVVTSIIGPSIKE